MPKPDPTAAAGAPGHATSATSATVSTSAGPATGDASPARAASLPGAAGAAASAGAAHPVRPDRSVGTAVPDGACLTNAGPASGLLGALGRRRCLTWFGAACLAACGGGGGGSGGDDDDDPDDGTTPGTERPRARALSDTLEAPWGLAFLPDGRLLVTEKAGRMRILRADGSVAVDAIDGVPPVVARGQGGLLDVVLDPDFAADPWIYWSYSEPGSGAEAGRAGTAVARGRLDGDRLADVEVILRQTPKVEGTSHFGARLVFRPDGTLFVTLGERERDDPARPGSDWAQNPAVSLGKVLRIERDGGIPADNPAFGAGAVPGLWSLGHRNPQGAAIHPERGELWVVEHGPQGGDELNRVLAGGNFGWPLRSYGCPYGEPVGTACRVGGGTHAPSYVEPVSTWVPTSIAPSGLCFYDGERFPQWRGHLFTGALAGEALWRLELDGTNEVRRERLFADLGERIRCVRQGPDGWLYLLTDSGRLIRIEQ